MIPPWRTLLAKALMRAHRVLVHVRVYQRHYTLAPDGSMPFAGWHWDSWWFAWRVLERARRVDAEHWTHWALDHSDCRCERPMVRCGVCGGEIDIEPTESS